MKVIHVSVECFPVAKVGGLADVVGALPRYQRKFGISSEVVCPYYITPFTKEHDFEVIFEGAFRQGGDQIPFTVLKEKSDVLGFPINLVHIPNILDREKVYCYPDEAEQWIAFQLAFLTWLRSLAKYPEVVHCHDHHVGLIPFLMKWTSEFRSLALIKSVITVHNTQSQGCLNWDKSALLPEFERWKSGLLDWDGVINPLASAIKCCDAFTTVSPGYFSELQQRANGLESLFRLESLKGFGILNGIDEHYWNPSSDPLIFKNYSRSSVTSGKKANKKSLCEKESLYTMPHLLAYIGRFVEEKGADLLPEIIEELFASPSNNLCVYILGSGNEVIEDRLEVLLAKYPKRLAVFFGYDEGLAHEVYAAADLLLMPSKVEPCGLNQLYAMKYGAIPVVRGTGGLWDTVTDVDRSIDGSGFVFRDSQPSDAVNAIRRALNTIGNADKVKTLRNRGMSLDFSWDKPANEYIDLYRQITN
ncbi:glycogen synthase [Sphingobacterium sp. Ag1]|uniref:glycogen synthase n=1 Tax=Sphingobacterium sp. Ag1 TaxID=1643451 RepID=UPI000627C9DA|nr:glycogen/starch synthase [Sphingobacterium sp. Ag1]KKO89252.1 glycogen synthase [Sphingobacterium sp. Ag1]